NIDLREFFEEPFSSSWIRRRRSRKSSENDNAGEMILAGQHGRKYALQRDAQKKHAIGIDGRMGHERPKRGLISCQFLLITDRAARRPLAIANSGLLDAHRNEALIADLAHEARLCSRRPDCRVDAAAAAALDEH